MDDSSNINGSAFHPAPAVHLPWGDSRNHIRLKNPFDVRPIADVVVRDMKEKLARREEGQPYSLIIGEQHSCSAHRMTQQLIFSRLLDEGVDFRIAFEQPANDLSIILKEEFFASIPEESAYKLADLDSNLQRGEVGLYVARVCGFHHFAYVSYNSIHSFCLANRIQTLNADAGYSFKMKGIDPLDPLLSKFGHVEPFGRLSAEGVRLRNYAMMKRCTSNDTPTVLLTGCLHMFGFSDVDPYNESLHALHAKNKSSMKMVSLLGNCDFPEDIPSTAFNDAVMVEGLDRTKFRLDKEAGQYPAAEEIEYMQKISEESGGEVGYFYVPDAQQKAEAKTAAYNFLLAANNHGFDIDIPDTLKPAPPKGWVKRVLGL